MAAWSDGIHCLQRDTYLCFLEAPGEHRAVGYHGSRASSSSGAASRGSRGRAYVGIAAPD